MGLSKSTKAEASDTVIFRNPASRREGEVPSDKKSIPPIFETLAAQSFELFYSVLPYAQLQKAEKCESDEVIKFGPGIVAASLTIKGLVFLAVVEFFFWCNSPPLPCC